MREKNYYVNDVTLRYVTLRYVTLVQTAMQEVIMMTMDSMRSRRFRFDWDWLGDCILN